MSKYKKHGVQTSKENDVQELPVVQLMVDSSNPLLDEDPPIPSLRFIRITACVAICFAVFMAARVIYNYNAKEEAFHEFMEETLMEPQDEEIVSGAMAMSLISNAAKDSVVKVHFTNGDATVDIHKDSGDYLTDSGMESLETAFKGRKADRFIVRYIRDKDGAYVGRLITER